MEKDDFIDVLKHYSEISESEALQVISLKESFPYSQLLHALSARVSKDHSFSDQQKELQLAAVYAADRAVLKDVMTLKNLASVSRPVVKKSSSESGTLPSSAPKSSPAVAAKSEVTAIADTGTIAEPGSLADQVLSDLEKLHQSKHNFEALFIDSGNHNIAVTEAIQSEHQPSSQNAADDHSMSGKSRKARIVELAKAMAAANEGEPLEEIKPKPKKKKHENPEAYIDEIASNKKAIEPENEKQKEQLEIIDQFIKTQPSISSPKDRPVPPPAGDLATIKTGEFNDNVVSETLVEILIKQGKKDKAIEVLKKLIWKFPQKKAYFAAQIEDLKSS